MSKSSIKFVEVDLLSDMDKQNLEFFNTRRYKLTLCVGLAVFFYLFLIYFQPFGVNNYDSNFSVEFLIGTTTFAVVTFFAAAINEFMARPLFIREPRVVNIVYWNCWTFVFLGIVNFLTYNIIGDWHDFSLISGVQFIGNATSIFIFPAIGIFFFFSYRSMRVQIQHVSTTVKDHFDPNQLLKFTGQGVNDQIMVTVSSFQYARAQDNYVELYFTEDGKLAKFLIRTSLTGMADQIANEAIARCHRSYLVNLYHIKSVRGGNEVRLYLDPFDTEIPVSKSYRDQIINKLKTLNGFR